MRARVVAAALAMLILNDFVAADNETPSLQIVVSPIRDDAIECGINGSSIEDVAALTLRNNGIDVIANSGGNKDAHVVVEHNPVLVISANVLRPPGNCIANLVIEIKEAVAPEHEHTGRFSPRDGGVWAVLCSSGTLMTVPAENASQHFYRNVAANVRGCLRQLKY